MSKPVVSRVGHILVAEFESWHDLRMELFKEVYEPLSVVFDEEIGKWRVSKVIAKDQREEYEHLLSDDGKDIA